MSVKYVRIPRFMMPSDLGETRMEEFETPLPF